MFEHFHVLISGMLSWEIYRTWFPHVNTTYIYYIQHEVRLFSLLRWRIHPFQVASMKTNFSQAPPYSRHVWIVQRRAMGGAVTGSLWLNVFKAVDIYRIMLHGIWPVSSLRTIHRQFVLTMGVCRQSHHVLKTPILYSSSTGKLIMGSM